MGETGDRTTAGDPGAFLLPGLTRYDSPSDVPRARPAAAIPMVPTAQSYNGCQHIHFTSTPVDEYVIPYRGNVLLIVFHYACEAFCPRGAADQMFWLL